MPKKVEKVVILPPFDSQEFTETWELYLKHRKEKGASNYTETGLNAVFKKLIRLCVGMEDVAIRILEQSIENNWTGIFPLKQETNGQTYFQRIGNPSAARANSNSKSAGAYQLLELLKKENGHS